MAHVSVHPRLAPKELFLAADHAVRGFRERWYPSLVDWQGEPPPQVLATRRNAAQPVPAHHVPRAAPQS